MKTMTHTKQQRKDWHAGKRKPTEILRWSAFNRARKRNNGRGAFTPSSAKKGITYEA